MPHHTASAAAIALTSCCAGALAGGGAGATFYGFPGYGAAVGVSDAGRVLITHNSGYQWTVNGGLTPLTNGTSFFYRISANGQFAAGTSGSFGFHYTMPSGPLFTIPHFQNGEAATATGISADGSVVVGFEATQSSGYRPFRWTAATGTVQINTPEIAQALDVSRDGNIMVGGANNHPFLYSQATGQQNVAPFQTFEVSQFERVSAGGVYAIGDGYSINNGVRVGSAFRWRQGLGYQDLGAIGTGPNPANQAYQALACNADATLIGGSQGSRRAWIWDPTNGMRDLAAALTADYGMNLANWRLERVLDISADGRFIVGDGGYFTGQGFSQSAWVVMIPAPGTAIAFSGVALLALRRRR